MAHWPFWKCTRCQREISCSWRCRDFENRHTTYGFDPCPRCRGNYQIVLVRDPREIRIKLKFDPAALLERS